MVSDVEIQELFTFGSNPDLFSSYAAVIIPLSLWECSPPQMVINRMFEPRKVLWFNHETLQFLSVNQNAASWTTRTLWICLKTYGIVQLKKEILVTGAASDYNCESEKIGIHSSWVDRQESCMIGLINNWRVPKVVDPQVTTGFNTKMIYLVLDDLGYHVKNPAIVPQGGVSVRNR